MDTNQFLIELQAKLDEAASKGLINSDIASLQDKLDKLKLQATLDPNAAQKLANDIGKLINQKITISNINVDSEQAVKEAQKTGRQIGDAVNKGISSSIKDIKNEISNTVKSIPRLNAANIIKEMNLNRGSVETDVVDKVRLLTTEINKLGREAAKTNSDSSWEQLITKCTDLGKILDTFGKQRSFPGLEDIQRFADYFNGKTLSVGYKSSGLSGTDFTTSQLNKDLKQLGVRFSATKHEAIELDRIWEEMCETTGRMDLLNITTAIDQLQTIICELQKAQSFINGEKGLEPHPNAYGTISNHLQKVEQARDVILNLQDEMSALMQKETQESTASANTIIQNEERKQNAIHDTAKIQDQLRNNGNIIQQTDFATSFDTKGQAEEYFNTLSKIVSVQGKLGNDKNLESFIVEVKNAKGAVEKLTYKYNELTGAFEYSGGSINNNGIQKQIDAIKTKASRLQDTFESLKSKYSDLNASNPIKEQSHISELENQYKKVAQAIESVKASDSATFSSMTSHAESEIKALQRMGEEFKRAETISMRMNGSDIASGLEQAQERFQKLRANSVGFEQMTETIQKLDAAIASVGDKSSLKTFVDQLKVAEAQLDRIKAETKSMAQANKIQFLIDTGGYETRVRSLIAQTQQWTDEFGNAKINTTALTTALDNLGKASTTLSNKNTLENQKALIAAEKELDAQIRMVTNSVKVMNSETMKSSAVDSLRQSYQEFYDKNGAAHKQWGNQLKQNMLELAEGAEVSKRRGEELKQELVQIQNAARQAGKLGKSGLQKLFEGFKSFSYWTSSTFILMKVIQSVKSGIGTVKALDTALVDLKKTTTMTNSELEDFYYSSNKVAKQMGVTTEEIINQAAAWSRLGFSSNEAATKMAQLSSKFSSISPGMSTDEAQEGLVSIIKANTCLYVQKCA